MPHKSGNASAISRNEARRPSCRIHLRHLLEFGATEPAAAGMLSGADVGFPLCVLRQRQQQERGAVSHAICRNRASTRRLPFMSAITRMPTSRVRGATASARATTRKRVRSSRQSSSEKTAVLELLCPGQPSRLDHGIRTLRRMAAAQGAERSAPFHLGMTVLGPIMTAFDAFVDARVIQLARTSGRVAIGFLGRDGFLSHRMWRATHGETAAYLEINRRVSLIGSADTLAPLCDLLGKVTRIDAPTLRRHRQGAAPEGRRVLRDMPERHRRGRRSSPTRSPA